MKRVLVTGGAGFLGSHLTKRLREEGCWVRGVDIQAPTWSHPDEFLKLDLRKIENARAATWGVDEVYDLGSDMGGIEYLSEHDAGMMTNNTLINLNVISAAYHYSGVGRYFFTSSACAYNTGLQQSKLSSPLKEEDAFPALADGGYGWQKLYHELVCKFFMQDYGIKTRVARFHNVYGMHNPWCGGREKAPAALCRKVAVAKLSGDPVVEIWGDGQQRRSFMYVDDCVEGLLRLMESDFPGPLNLGRDRVVTINELVDIIADIAGIKIVKKHIKGYEGVRSRNSDNSLCEKVLGWTPSIPLEKGLVPTYKWIEEQVALSMGVV